MLKWETAKANEESPGALPCLCVQEKQRWESLSRKGPHAGRIAFEKGRAIAPVNRLLPPRSRPVILIKEHVWRLTFDRRKRPPEATFEIDGLELHISAQAELRGATLLVVNDKIVVTYEGI